MGNKSEAAPTSYIGPEVQKVWIERHLCPICHVGPRQPCEDIEGFHHERKMDAAWAAEELARRILKF